MSSQNIYDNPDFFAGYQTLREDPDNAVLQEEKPALFSLAPDLTGKAVLDLGCGYGENCAAFQQRGASRVTGVDISEKMLAIAKTETHGIGYIQLDMSDLSGLSGGYDVIFSSLAVHYIADFNRLCAQVAKLLRDDGYFIFSQEHPLSTAPLHGPSWTKDENGTRLHYNLSDYLRCGKRENTWIVDGVVKYHRTLSELLNALIDNGFAIRRLVESTPIHDEKKQHKPNFLLVKARKNR